MIDYLVLRRLRKLLCLLSRPLRARGNAASVATTFAIPAAVGGALELRALVQGGCTVWDSNT
jgi:hypothetical protein